MSKWVAIAIAVISFGWGHLFANNLRFSSLTQVEDRILEVELGWENAWHLTTAPSNHDAVWLFLKGKTASGWQTLPVLSARSLSPDLVEVKAATDQMGVMVAPVEGVQGNVSCRVQLELGNGLDGEIEMVDLVGIEMVWVNGGEFELGDGVGNNTFGDGENGNPLLINSEALLPIGSGAEQLSDQGDYAPAGDLPAAWPKGVSGFYCMKYELSQAQYIDFLNHLTFAQQQARTVVSPDAAPGTSALSTGPENRNAIRIQIPGNDAQPAVYGCDRLADQTFDGPDDAQFRACNFLTWDDLTAYLDWAGLSPMTEFEYEKACRGPLDAVPGEFAWGTDAVVDANDVLQDGQDNEMVAERPSAPAGLASHGYTGPQGPLRCGFAADGSSTRLQAGASYFGIMELSGNLWELTVTVNGEGLGFTGGHGDGQLDDTGQANVAGWPSASGAGYRGGAWNSGILPGFRDLAVSDRFYAGLAPEQRRGTAGGRGVRR